MFDGSIVVPGSIQGNAVAEFLFLEALDRSCDAYDELVKLGIPKEDARYLLPNAAETKIVMTMNARELLHFFALRCCSRAQWEIRSLANQMLALCRQASPCAIRFYWTGFPVLTGQ